MLTEFQNHGMLDMLKTMFCGGYNPTKTKFCRGIKRKLKNLHFGENFVNIQQHLWKLFTVKHAFSDGFYRCKKYYYYMILIIETTNISFIYK